MTDLTARRDLSSEPMRLAGPTRGHPRGTVTAVRELAAHRELLGLLVRREIKARYKDSALGVVWSLIRPLVMLVIYYVAVGRFMHAAEVIPQFAVYIFAGLTAWGLFNEIVAAGTSSIIANAGLVKKVYLPREIFPLSTIGSAFFNFSVQLVILVAAMLIVGAPALSDLAYFPLALAVLTTFGTALALMLSAVNVYLRDTQYLVEVALMILFWASPIVYSWVQVRDALSPFFLDLYLSNPVTLAALGFQKAFWEPGATFPYPDAFATRLWISLAVSLLLMWIGQRVFARLQGNFAQEL
jgi:ABC-2 type transport system permease protein